MLSERHLQLLTAFVDGELSRRQRKAVLRLLHRSSEARAILRELQENAHKLKELPVHPAPAGLAEQVLRTIAERGLKPTPDQPRPLSASRRPRWLGYAAAASLLLAAAGLAIYLSRGTPSSGPGPLAANPASKEIDPLVSSLLQGTFSTFAKEIPPPPRFAFRDLEAKREAFASELRKESAVHLDLTVRSNARAVERLGEVMLERGIKLVVDPRAQARLKKGQVKEQFLVYAENVRPQEIEEILRQIARDEGAAKNPRKGTFEAMVISGFSTEDRNNLSGLLGIDVSEFPEPQFFEGTVIEGSKDKVKRAPPTAAPARLPDRLALVLPQSGAAGGISAEVKQFLAGRRAQRPGTMQVLMVIHQA